MFTSFLKLFSTNSQNITRTFFRKNCSNKNIHTYSLSSKIFNFFLFLIILGIFGYFFNLLLHSWISSSSKNYLIFSQSSQSFFHNFSLILHSNDFSNRLLSLSKFFPRFRQDNEIFRVQESYPNSPPRMHVYAARDLKVNGDRETSFTPRARTRRNAKSSFVNGTTVIDGKSIFFTFFRLGKMKKNRERYFIPCKISLALMEFQVFEWQCNFTR